VRTAHHERGCHLAERFQNRRPFPGQRENFARASYGFLLLETLRDKKNFWVDPPNGSLADAKNPGHLDRQVPHMQEESPSSPANESTLN